MSRALSPSVLLGVELSALMSRHRYDSDTEPVIQELRKIAGERTEILAWEAGVWAGY